MRLFSKLFVIVFFLIPFYTGCSQDQKPVLGNYQIQNEEINISDYSEIEINLPAEVIYQQYSDSLPYLQVSADQNIFSHLNIRVEDHRLIVEAKPDSIINPTKLKIYTTSTSLEKIELNDAGDLRLAGEVNSLNLTIDHKGSGEIRTDSLLCHKLQINLQGSGLIALNGAAGHSSFSITGSGNVDTNEFYSEDWNGKIDI